jgi:protein-disulfide isomerase
VAERLRAIESAQFQLLAQIKALQTQIGELNTRLLALTTPPRRPEETIPQVAVPIAGSPRLGKADARIVIIEFSDFQCPYCGRFFGDAYPALKKEFIDTGKAVFVFRHLPLTNIHPKAMAAGYAAACAGEQGKFWEMHDALFRDQARLEVPQLRDRAVRLGLNMSTFDACLMKSGPAIVDRDLDLAKSLRIMSTPAFLIGNIQPDGTVKIVQRVSGAQPFAVFKAALEKVPSR